MSASVDEKTGFELFLEGIKVPYSSITIQENEGSFPQASFSMAATSMATQILEGTIVQVFGPTPAGEKSLLFEGEVHSISYQKGSQGRVVSYQCSSIFRHFNEARVRPKDAMVSRARAIAEGAPHDGTTMAFSNNSSINGPKTNKSYQEQLNEALDTFDVEDVNKENLKNISLTTKSPFIIAFTRLMSAKNEDGEKISKGELHKLVSFFLNYFEQNSLYYGMLSRGFKIPESIYGWPNADRFKTFKNKMILNKSLKAMSSMSSGNSGSSARLVTALKQFLEITKYNMQFPAAPTHAQQFWTGDTDRGPHRGSFMPSLDNAPPAMCNLFFPDQVTSFSYQRPMMQEPTRAVGTFTIMGASEKFTNQGLTPQAYAPRMEITQEAIENNKLIFTEEETYRGITTHPPFDVGHLMANPTIEALKEKDEGEDNVGSISLELSEDMFHFGKDIEQDTLNGFGDSLQQLTVDKYLQARYEGRMMTAEVEWSPYRMVGLPGMIVENNGPSIGGVISSITTQIDSGGSATSSISFRAPRLIQDDENIFSAKEGSSEGIYQHVINSFTRDGYLDTNYFLYDPELYNFTNIGADLYNFLIYGDGSEYGNKMNEEGSESGFSDLKDAINKLDPSPVKDASILNYIKDEDGNISSDLINEEDPAEVRYAKIIVEALRATKQQYKGIKETQPEENLKKAFGKINFRRLTSKTDYFDYLGVELQDSLDRVQPDEYKDSVKVFNSFENYKKVHELIKQGQSEDNPTELNNLIEQYEKKQAKIKSIQDTIDKIQQRQYGGQGKYVTNRISSMEESYNNKTAAERNELHEQFKDEYWDILNGSADNPLSKQIEQLQEESEKLSEKIEELQGGDDESLESEAFKLYNLIRRAHVELMLKDIESVGSVDVINNN